MLWPLERSAIESFAKVEYLRTSRAPSQRYVKPSSVYSTGESLVQPFVFLLLTEQQPSYYFPDPDRFSFSGLYGKSLVTVITPVCLPTLVGVKVTVNVHDEPLGSELGQLLVWV